MIYGATGIKNADGVLQSNITTITVFDKFGNVLSQTDGKGNITEYEYDCKHRLTKVTYPDNTANIYSYESNVYTSS